MVDKRERYGDRHRLNDYRVTFGGGEGKRVLHDLIARHYVLGPTYAPDMLTMAHREGQRDVVLHILRYMQLTPADIPQARQTVLEQFELEGLDNDR